MEDPTIFRRRRLPRSTTNTPPKITATIAKKEFALSDRDLDSIDCVEAVNPHHRSGAPVRLFERRDIMHAAYAKHGDQEGVERALERRKVAAEKRAETRRDVIQERRNQLHVALATRGLVLREDSRRCDEFVVSGRGTLDEVVDTMEEMDFYFRWSEYVKIRDRIMDEEWAEIRSARDTFGYEMEWIPPPDRDEVSDRAKSEALGAFVAANGILDPLIPRSLRRG